jgi:hypothetical protein
MQRGRGGPLRARCQPRTTVDVDLSASRVSPGGEVQLVGTEGASHLRFDFPVRIAGGGWVSNGRDLAA